MSETTRPREGDPYPVAQTGSSAEQSDFLEPAFLEKTPENTAAYMRALAQAVSERPYALGHPPYDMDSLERSFKSDLISTLAIKNVAGEVIGAANLLTIGQDQITLLTLFRLESARGQQIGTRLLLATLQWANEQGIPRVALQVLPHNTGARLLYTYTGFEQYEQQFKFIEDGSVDMHLNGSDAILAAIDRLTQELAQQARANLPDGDRP